MKPNDKAHQDRQGKFMIAGCVAVILALLVAQAMFQSASGKVDPITLCRTDRPLLGHTVVLVDVSDAMAAEELRQLRLRVESIRKEIPQGAMLSVFFVNESSTDVLSERFCKCNPGDGSAANPLWSAPVLIAKKWQTAFGAPLDSALREAAQYSESNASPILEAIRYVTEHDDFTRTTTHRKLVVVSDMIQNSDRFSQYGGVRSFAEFMKTEAAAELMPDLRDAQVEVEYLIRPKYHTLQNDHLKQFWQDYFAHAGARTPVVFRTVRGSYKAKNEIGEKRPPTTGATGDSAEPEDSGQAGQSADSQALDAQTSISEEAPVDDTPLSLQGANFANPQGAREPHPPAAPDVKAATAEQTPPPGSDPPPQLGFREQAYVDELPAVIKQTPPVYPEAARSLGVQGTVTLRALVGEDGRVKEIEILKGKSVLNASAVAAAREWVFKPGSVNGKPMAVWVTIPVTFKR